MADKGGKKIICVNRRARFDYAIDEVFEAGLVLQGTEVKSLRAGRATLKDAYAEARDGEMFLLHAHINQYEQANRFNHEPERPRKLLLHKREIHRLAGKARERGLTLIPTRMYFSRGKAKVELGLAKGKRQYDKRQDMKRRDAQRDIARALAGE
jgi:SsrA-binding protein